MEGVDVSGQLKRRRLGKGSWQKTLHYNCISHCQDKRRKGREEEITNTKWPPTVTPHHTFILLLDSLIHIYLFSF